MKLLIFLGNLEKDLDSIKHALGNLDCSLTVEEGKVIISSSSLVGHVDLKNNKAISSVWEKVKDFIEIINGSAIVEGVSMNLVVLHYIKYVDTDGEIKFLPNIGNMYAVLPGLRGSEPDISKFIPLALKDKTVAKVLRLFCRELDWVNLYRIYEVISENIDEPTSKEFKIFKGSANSSKISGDESRHGKMNVGTPKETMSLADAQHLLKSKVRVWVHSKLNSEQIDS